MRKPQVIPLTLLKNSETIFFLLCSYFYPEPEEKIVLKKDRIVQIVHENFVRHDVNLIKLANTTILETLEKNIFISRIKLSIGTYENITLASPTITKHPVYCTNQGYIGHGH